MELEEYLQYQEKQIHERPGFKYNTYLCSIPDDFAKVDPHWHTEMEIVYIKKGRGSVSIGAQSHSVGAGVIIPIMPGEVHSIEGGGGRMEYENIIFSLSLLESPDEDDWAKANVLTPLRSAELAFERPIAPGTELHKQVSAILDEIDRVCGEGREGHSLLVKSGLFRLLYALYSHRLRSREENKKTHDEALKRVMSYVKEHYSEEISLETAAEIAGYSPSHFMRFFRQETGQTFIGYVLDYRLSYASYLLKESSGHISEIAMSCGFNNLSYFIRTFKKKYGLSPRDYRKTVEL
ncbi:MAG: helix-turn-helix domain-containing protein [Oscillospiraceae bacterium]|nr:helix-turn-helix domain-containing protein [Oscillospiraceae bacterium]